MSQHYITEENEPEYVHLIVERGGCMSDPGGWTERRTLAKWKQDWEDMGVRFSIVGRAQTRDYRKHQFVPMVEQDLTEVWNRLDRRRL